MTDGTSLRRGSSSRVARFGPRSLVARLLVLLLVPLLGLQWFAVREVRGQGRTAESAAEIGSGVPRLQSAIRLLVTHSLEATAAERVAGTASEGTAELAAVLAGLDAAATTRSLADIASETEQLVISLSDAATELRLLAVAGSTDPPAGSAVKLLAASGAADASRDRLRALIAPARQPAFDEMVGQPAFAQAKELLPVWAEAHIAASLRSPSAAADAGLLDVTARLESASKDRLRLMLDYSDGFLGEQARIVDDIEATALEARHDALVVMIAAAATGLVLLTLLLASILWPLRRLVRQARQVSDGYVALTPMKLSGPTDVRVVVHTFNEMVTTLRSYDGQVRGLALGQTKTDTTLPGPLGDTLRESMGHLAAVTSKLNASQAAADLLARTDALTGLANRAAALEQLARLSVQARLDSTIGAIVFLNLDGFKSVNDTQGHGEGDRILAEIGARLKGACPHELVARLGGDEFIVLIERIGHADDATALAHRLIEVVSAPCTGTNGQLFTISASAGVALVDGHSDPFDSIARADSAVYHAKESGRGHVELYDERLARGNEDRADMALTMRQGLLNNEFGLRLQPIIDIATKEPVGAEALLRWNRPGIGEVGPNEFIPIAERTGVILDIDAWVLEQSVQVLKDWADHPLTADLRIAVNISGRHIIDGSLSPLLTRLCDLAGVDPGKIDLEITETHLVADVARASAVVDDLRSQGIKIAIDDFGTGYSSMGYLHELTVDTLKIDQGFIAGMSLSPLDHTIVELLLRLGDSLGLKVVAEGVDSDDKLNELALLGCPLAQGYYIARPMTVADATIWLRQQVTLASLL